MKNFFKLLLHNMSFMIACSGISACIMGFVVGWTFVTMGWFVWPLFVVILTLLFSLAWVKI